MASKICPVCGGSGGFKQQYWQGGPDPYRTERHICTTCSGSGQVFEPDRRVDMPSRRRSGDSGAGSGKGLGVLILVVAGIGAAYWLANALWRQVEPYVPRPLQHAWNAESYHEGSGPVVHSAQTPLGTVTLYRLAPGHCAGSACYKLVTLYAEAGAPSPPDVEAQVLQVFGHVPYRRERDLILYRIERKLSYGYLSSETGYSPYDPDSTDAIKRHVSEFLEREGQGAATIACRYQGDGSGKWSYAALHWFKTRPAGADPVSLRRQFGAGHPLLKIAEPIALCPARFDG